MKASNANKVISVLLSVAMRPMMVPSAAFAAEDDAASDASSPSDQTQPADQAAGAVLVRKLERHDSPTV